MEAGEIAAMTAEEILETPDLIAVGIEGDDVRRRIHGTRTTFVRVLELHVDAPLTALPPRTHAGEIRIVGKPVTLHAAETAVQAAAALANGIPLTGFSLFDLQGLTDPLSSVCGRLRRAGLDAIAQVPIDWTTNLHDAVRTVYDAGLEVGSMTLEVMVPGANPSARDERLRMCERAAELRSVVGAIRAFAPLSRTIAADQPTTGYDDARMIALARVVCANVPSIQVDWQLYGPKMAQVALTVGADDVDNVSAVDPGILGTRRSPVEEIKRNIQAAGLEAVERDGLFRDS
jgi:aminodeoxyfutalosine synthase